MLSSLSEEYYQFHDKDFSGHNEKDMKKERFRLLLSMVFKEYAKAVDDADDDEEKEDSIFESSCHEKESFTVASSIVDFEITVKNAEQNYGDGIPKPFKIDPNSLNYVPDTYHDEEVVIKEEMDLTSIPETSNMEKIETTTLFDNISGGSSNGSPSILSRKKKRPKMVSNPIKFDESANNLEMKTAVDCEKPNENDSFDEYHPVEDENAWKYNNLPVKKKSEREKLKGFACANCEEYYKNANLTEKQLQDLLQKCSRHRATIPPPMTSPKEMWELDISGPPDKTQYVSPLKTRDRRKLLNLENMK